MDIKKPRRIEVVGHRGLTEDRSQRKRGASWNFLHVCVKTPSHLTYIELMADDKVVTSNCHSRTNGKVERFIQVSLI
jgi:phage terminase small subunit